jgi:hypothetical protein
VVLAGPIVVVLWVTIGLPMMSQLTSAAGANRLARKVVFEAEPTASGGAGGGEGVPATAAAAVVSKKVLAAYHAEVERQARAHARRRARSTTPLANLTLPAAPRPATTTEATTLATADLPKAPPTRPADLSQPPKNAAPAAGSSSPGSGDANASPGSSSGGDSATGPGIGSATGGGPPDASGTDDGGAGNNGAAGSPGPGGDVGGGNAGGNGSGGAPSPPPAAPPTSPPPTPPAPSPPAPPAPSPPPPPPPPPAPPPPPPPAAPSAPPTPADVQTRNGGGPHGKPKKGDSIVFSFSSAPDPSLILPGWTGSATTVTVLITDKGKNDVLTVLNPTTGLPLALGSVQLGGDYADRQNVTIAGSTMTLSGSAVTVVLGTTAGRVGNEQKSGTMIWSGPGGTATESGPADNEF